MTQFHTAQQTHDTIPVQRREAARKPDGAILAKTEPPARTRSIAVASMILQTASLQGRSGHPKRNVPGPTHHPTPHGWAGVIRKVPGGSGTIDGYGLEYRRSSTGKCRPRQRAHSDRVTSRRVVRALHMGKYAADTYGSTVSQSTAYRGIAEPKIESLGLVTSVVIDTSACTNECTIRFDNRKQSNDARN
jgi:hypothetical protein